MKKFTPIIPFLCLMIFSFSQIQAQDPPPPIKADDIVGIWTDENTKDTLKFEKIGDVIFARIYKLKVPNDASGNPRTDIKNPDLDRRDDPLQGLIYITKLNYSDSVWTFKKYYDYYDTGLTQPCIMEFRDPNKKDILDVVIQAQSGDKTTHFTKKKDDK